MDLKIRANIAAYKTTDGMEVEAYDVDIADVLDQIGVDECKRHFHLTEIEELF